MTASPMRQLLATHDLSLALSLRLALEAANVKHSANFGDGANPTRAPLEVLVHDKDYERARGLLRDLQVTTTADSSNRFLLIAGALFATMVIASLVVFVINAIRN